MSHKGNDYWLEEYPEILAQKNHLKMIKNVKKIKLENPDPFYLKPFPTYQEVKDKLKAQLGKKHV